MPVKHPQQAAKRDELLAAHQQQVTRCSRCGEDHSPRCE
jgi:hypothetical protein